jgi:hypothetical protein
MDTEKDDYLRSFFFCNSLNNPENKGIFVSEHSPDTAGRAVSLLGAQAPAGSHGISRYSRRSLDNDVDNKNRTLTQPKTLIKTYFPL